MKQEIEDTKYETGKGRGIKRYKIVKLTNGRHVAESVREISRALVNVSDFMRDNNNKKNNKTNNNNNNGKHNKNADDKNVNNDNNNNNNNNNNNKNNNNNYSNNDLKIMETRIIVRKTKIIQNNSNYNKSSKK